MLDTAGAPVHNKLYGAEMPNAPEILKTDRSKEVKMYYQVVVRFSLDGDSNSKVRNSLTSKLSSLGLSQSGTGTWESWTLPTADVAMLMQHIASVLNEMPQDVAFDHIWLYLYRRS